MKIKITISIEEVHNQVERYFKLHYQEWIDFACFHNKSAATKVDVIKLLFDAEIKVHCLGRKQAASLLYSKRDNITQLDIFVLRYIKKSIRNPRPPE